MNPEQLPTTSANKPLGYELVKPVEWVAVIKKKCPAGSCYQAFIHTKYGTKVVGHIRLYKTKNSIGLCGWNATSIEGYSLCYMDTPEKAAQAVVDYYYMYVLDFIQQSFV